MQYGLSEKQLAEVIAILRSFPEIGEAVLFGSRAIDTFKEASDVDIALKGKGVTAALAAKLKFHLEEETYQPFFFDFVAYPTITNEALREHINTKGVVVFRRGWKECKFSEVLVDGSISYGIVQPGSHTDVKFVPIIRVNNIKSGLIKADDHLRVAASIERKYQRTRLEGGELLITVVGSVGECAIVPESLKGWNVARAVSVARIKDGFDKRFIRYCFSLEDVRFQLYANTNDTVQPTLNLSSLKEIRLTLPPLPEQKAIASVLSSIDDKIDLLHRQNKTLEAMAETLFRQWFVEEAQADWEDRPLGDIATVQNGYAFSSRDYVEHQIGHLEVFKMGHIEPGGGLRYSPKSDFVPRAEKLKRWILSEGDIVMAMTDMKDSMGILGHPAMIDKSDTYVLNQRVARIYLNSDESLINNHFLYLQLKTDVAIAIIQSKAHGGVQVNLSTEAIKSMPIIIPPKPDQEKGFKLLEGYLLKSQNNRKQIRTLEKLRDTLLPKLMSGEVRVAYTEN